MENHETLIIAIASDIMGQREENVYIIVALTTSGNCFAKAGTDLSSNIKYALNAYKDKNGDFPKNVISK